MAAENNLNEKVKKKVGDTIVDGTIDSIKTKIAENIDDIIADLEKGFKAVEE